MGEEKKKAGSRGAGAAGREESRSSGVRRDRCHKFMLDVVRLQRVGSAAMQTRVGSRDGQAPRTRQKLIGVDKCKLLESSLDAVGLLYKYNRLCSIYVTYG